MASDPWFKLYAAETLTDEGLDALPLEAQMIVVRMWCVICMHGHISPDPSEIARRCMLKPEGVLHLHMHLQNILQMFKVDADGLLYSERMDAEKLKSGRVSAARRHAANVKHGKELPAHAHANDDAKRDAKPLHQKLEVRDKSISVPENSDETIIRILKLHPANDHLSETEIPNRQLTTVAQLCADGDTEALLKGTAEFRRAMAALPEKDRKFETGYKAPMKFWEGREYRKYAKSATETTPELTVAERKHMALMDIPDWEKKPVAEMRELHNREWPTYEAKFRGNNANG